MRERDSIAPRPWEIASRAGYRAGSGTSVRNPSEPRLTRSSGTSVAAIARAPDQNVPSPPRTTTRSNGRDRIWVRGRVDWDSRYGNLRKLRRTKIRDWLPLQEWGTRWTQSSGSRDSTVFAEPFRPQPSVPLHRARYLLCPLTRVQLRIVALPGQRMTGPVASRMYPEGRHWPRQAEQGCRK